MSRFTARYVAQPHTVAELREEIAKLAREAGLDQRTVEDVRLAVSEAASNAILHAYREQPGEIEVEAELADGELRIAVKDRGIGMRPRTDSPGLGLGLPVIASVAARIEVRDHGPGTEVRMAFPRFPRPEGGPLR